MCFPPNPTHRPTLRETAFLIGICLVPAIITLAVVSFFVIAIGGQIR